MLASYKETETAASRVIYINSKDATSIMGDNRSDFDFTLDEPIVVPPHHNIHHLEKQQLLHQLTELMI